MEQYNIRGVSDIDMTDQLFQAEELILQSKISDNRSIWHYPVNLNQNRPKIGNPEEINDLVNLLARTKPRGGPRLQSGKPLLKSKSKSKTKKLKLQVSTPVEKTSLKTMDEIHSRFIQPIDRKYWLDKIWKTAHLESHAEEEPITILYWFKYNGVKKAYSDRDVKFGPKNSICGPCHITVDRSQEQTADAIMISNGPLLNWQKTGRYHGMENYKEDGFENPLPSFENRNPNQFWIFQMKESAAKGGDQTLLMTEDLDGAFNLTSTYRRDSDVTRHFGDIENSIYNQPKEQIYEAIMKSKQPYGEPLERFDKAWGL